MSQELQASQPSTRSQTQRSPAKGGQVWLANVIFVIYAHIVALIVLLCWRPVVKTFVLTLILWQSASIGITMGYHRLWSHRSFAAAMPLRLVLALFGTMGFQGSIKWWAERHRLHHRFTDTEHDPYNAKRGFWHSHMGWILQRPYYAKLPLIDVSDLMRDPIVRLQHRFYVPLAILCGFVMPAAIAWLWNDIWGGLLFAGHISKILIWHSTFCINSFAHWIGSQDYSLQFTARGNLLLALLTCGEGHHNFHHEFPHDYRNGVRWFHWDPTKWIINLAHLVGLASSLKVTREIDIRKALLLTAEQKLKEAKAELDWGTPSESLPLLSKAVLSERVLQGEKLIIIDGYIYNVAGFTQMHPGGAKILLAYVGRDASAAFNGELNLHTQAARTQALSLRIARFAP